MTSIVDLVRPEMAFDPETIGVLSAALEEAWDRLLQSESECARPAYACYARDRWAAHHRYGATGHQGPKSRSGLESFYRPASRWEEKASCALMRRGLIEGSGTNAKSCLNRFRQLEHAG
jgi:hypothetical protein